ncbi:hypothetical protein [Segatella hominis]|uniref:hypothetical protein n=1 Tax=Segatella hominis TaxID=2518605 RepID=UPI003F7FFFD9
MGFILDDLTLKRPATAVIPFTDFPDDNAVKPEVAVPVQTTDTEPGKGTAIDTTGVTKVEPNQGIKIDWSRPYSEIEQNPLLRQMKPYDIMRDFQKNGDGNWSFFMPWLNTLGDGDKTVADNEALKKKAERKAKMEQWGNFLMHLGNFIGTVQGAPSQKIESAQELTDRQRKIRESTESLRAKGYDQMMVNIWKDRQDKQAQMQAEAAAKANEKLAEYRGALKNQVDALTPEKVEEVIQSARRYSTAADFNESKEETEDFLRGKKGKLLDNQADAAAAKAADSRSHVAVNNSTTARNNAATNKTIRTTPKYSQAEYGKRFIKYFNHLKKQGGNNLASIYEKKYGIGQNGDTGKQWNASLQRMFVDDVEEQGLAPKSLGIGIGRKSNNGKTNKGKHLKL